MRRASLDLRTLAWCCSTRTSGTARVLSTVPLSKSQNYGGDRSRRRNWNGATLSAAAGVVFAGSFFSFKKDEKAEILNTVGKRKDGLPEFRNVEVVRHKEPKDRIWVTYHDGVYDITDFVDKHPKQIMWAAGGRLEPFFNWYTVHLDNVTVMTELENCRIGNLHPDDVAANKELAKKDILKSAGKKKPNLPEYRKSHVATHDEEKKRIWVTFNQGVYDITEFVPKHPGAKNILMAAGGSLEPFWNLYAVHNNNAEIYAMLEEYRVGNLHPDDVKENEELAKTWDPYLMEPKRNPELLVNSAKPFNAETPLNVLAEHFYTPNDWFYVRNHLPTPEVTGDEYMLEVEAGKQEATFNLEDLKSKFEKVEVTAAVQCGGNRRAEMQEIKPIKGLNWKGGAIGNAKWAGARLSDVLAGYDLKGVKHVQFEGYDEGSDGSPYGASIPIEKAMSGDVVLAYEMNGKELPRDHGYPIRVIVPGVVVRVISAWNHM